MSATHTVQDVIDGLKLPLCFPSLPCTNSSDTEEKREVKVVQTHMSVVFLVGSLVFKVKKPVNYGWVDFSSLDKREFFCNEEIELNRRLAPDVYLGVSHIVRTNDVGGNEDMLRVLELNEDLPSDASLVLEPCVMMRRLNDNDTLQFAVNTGSVRPSTIQSLARRIQNFHDNNCIVVDLPVTEIRRNVIENFNQTRSDVVKGVVDQQLFDEVERMSSEQLDSLSEVLEQRNKQGNCKETHGDLRLEHVYIHEKNPTQNNGDKDPVLNDEEKAELRIIDCIEFNKQFRCNDVLNDMAFLRMELFQQGRTDLAQLFMDTYLDAQHSANIGKEPANKEPVRGGEHEKEQDIIDFFCAYRAVVRAKVSGMKAAQTEVPELEREQAAKSALIHWRVARSFLVPAAQRPVLVLVGGLPGTGKSTLAQQLADGAGARGKINADVVLCRSDVVRKTLAGVPVEERIATDLGSNESSADKSKDLKKESEIEGGLYTAEHTERTYSRCEEIAREALCRGSPARVIVDASFTSSALRERFFKLGQELGVATVLLWCEADREIVRTRIASRSAQGRDASDADWKVFEYMEKRTAAECALMYTVRTDGGVDVAVAAAVDAVKGVGVVW